jgi:hypothetical protein
MSGHLKAFEMLVARSSSKPQAEEEEGGMCAEGGGKRDK